MHPYLDSATDSLQQQCVAPRFFHYFSFVSIAVLVSLRLFSPTYVFRVVDAFCLVALHKKGAVINVRTRYYSMYVDDLRRIFGFMLREEFKF